MRLIKRLAIVYLIIGLAYAAYCMALGSGILDAVLGGLTWPIWALQFLLVMALCYWPGRSCS